LAIALAPALAAAAAAVRPDTILIRDVALILRTVSARGTAKQRQAQGLHARGMAKQRQAQGLHARR
jgi:hypothetical protein